MAEREAQVAAFLSAHGWGAARRQALGGDASFRRYVRLEGGARPALLMDAPPPMEDVRPFVAVARHLRALGFSAPEILAEDLVAGLLVIEDFGDQTYTRRLAADAADERELYTLAIDVLIALHRHADAAAIELPPYDEALLLEEANLLVDWYLPALRGAPTPEEVREEYADTWRGLFPLAEGGKRTLVLRDYHVDNLMWLAGRTGVARCGLLDFQDAVIGSAAYDLVSLLEDARRDIGPALIADMRARYRAAFAGLDVESFEAAYAMLGAQRNCKIIGIFTRLCVRDGKDAYLPHLPRVWRLLEADLAHQALAPMRAWLDRHIPAEDRRIPACRPAA